MPQFHVLPLLVTAALTACAWLGLRRFGGRKYRGYAAPAAGAVLIAGLNVGCGLSSWVVAAGLLAAPFFFKRGVKAKLGAVAAKIPEISVEKLGLTLVLQPDPSGRHVAQWAERVAPGAGPSVPLILTLDFEGDQEEAYHVTVWGASRKFSPVHLVVHHPETVDALSGLPKALTPLGGIPGFKDWSVLCRPFDFALLALDAKAAALFSEIFALRTDERELYLEVQGGVIRLVSDRTLTEDELRRLLPPMAVWIATVREVFARYQPPPED